MSSRAPAPRESRRGLVILLLAAVLVVGGFAGLIAWLSLTYEPPPPPVAAAAPEPAPAPAPAGTMQADAAKPTEETKPAEETKPLEEAKPAAEPATAETPPADDAPAARAAATPEETPASDAGAAAPEPPAPASDETTPATPAPDSETAATPETAAAETPPENAPAQPDAGPAATPAAPETAAATQAAPPTAAPAATGVPPSSGPYGPQSPLQRFAQPTATTAKAVIALVLYDLGQRQAPTNAAIAGLPAAVTLALSPYGSDLADWAEKARAAGHEVLIEVPMQPLDYPQSDYGPLTLLLSDSNEQIEDKLARTLGRFEGHVGALTVRGGRYTANAERLEQAMARLQARGLMFVDSGDDSSSSTLGLARRLGMPAVVADRFLDEQASRPNIDGKLVELERLALERGWAVGIGASFPVTIERIGTWSRTLVDRDIALVPISHLAFRRP